MTQWALRVLLTFGVAAWGFDSVRVVPNDQVVDAKR